MIDAAGAIYVIGGYLINGDNTYTLYHDVWASTDGGARLDYLKGGVRGGGGGGWGTRWGTWAILRGTKW